MGKKHYRLYSWNVNGLRAVWKKGFTDWIAEAQPDVVGLQEAKISAHQLTLEMTCMPVAMTPNALARKPSGRAWTKSPLAVGISPATANPQMAASSATTTGGGSNNAGTSASGAPPAATRRHKSRNLVVRPGAAERSAGGRRQP